MTTPGNYSILYTEAPGNTILSSRWNAQHQDHIDKMEPQYMDDYSSTVAQMKTTENPGEDGSESQPTSLQGEITRLRFAILETKQVLDSGISYWYESPTTTVITGAGTVTDNAVVRYNGTSGGSVQDSKITIDDKDQITLPTTTITTSSSNTTFTATTGVDGTAWDLSGVVAGDFAEASGGSYGVVSSVDDGADTVTVSSWVGGTPSSTETITIKRYANIAPGVQVGDGTGTGTDPDLIINKDSGDAVLRLQVNKDSANAWDLRNDNSDDDNLKFEYNGNTAFIIDDSVSETIKVMPANSAGPGQKNAIYANTLIKAWATITSTGSGTSLTVTEGVGVSSASINTTTKAITVNLSDNMANSNYSVFIQNYISSNIYPIGVSLSASSFSFRLRQEGTSIFDFNASAGYVVSVLVIGEQA